MGLVNNHHWSPTWSDFFFTPIGNADYIRVMHHIGGSLALKANEIEYRYEQTGDIYRLQAWGGGVEKQVHENVAKRPAWLTEIVTVAVVGNAAHRPTAAPPDFLLWFRTDRDHNLIEFVDID